MNATKHQELGTKLAKRNALVAKLQSFADTLDMYRARVEIGSGSWDMNVVWLKWEAHGCERVRSRACGLTTHGIRYIKQCMKEVEASID